MSKYPGKKPLSTRNCKVSTHTANIFPRSFPGLKNINLLIIFSQLWNVSENLIIWILHKIFILNIIIAKGIISQRNWTRYEKTTMDDTIIQKILFEKNDRCKLPGSIKTHNDRVLKMQVIYFHICWSLFLEFATDEISDTDVDCITSVYFAFIINNDTKLSLLCNTNSLHNFKFMLEMVKSKLATTDRAAVLVNCVVS